MAIKYPYRKNTFNQVEKNNPDVDKIFRFDFGVISCFFTYKHVMFEMKSFQFIVSHFQFFAESDGWEQYTGTGFKSIYFQHSSKTHFSESDIREMFEQELKEQSFSIPAQVQCDLF